MAIYRFPSLSYYELHAQHLAAARMFHVPHSVIRFSNSGRFELAHTYFFNDADWAAYDAAALALARKGLTGAIGDPLPLLLSAAVHELINDDPEAFAERVRLSAYALAMERVAL